ncbi:hypothetical protein [Streptomyces sp.]
MRTTRTTRTASPIGTERNSAQCPRCGGVLAVTQDGWKICHTCGYSSPP